jgi:hypothetical protein
MINAQVLLTQCPPGPPKLELFPQRGGGLSWYMSVRCPCELDTEGDNGLCIPLAFPSVMYSEEIQYFSERTKIHMSVTSR